MSTGKWYHGCMSHTPTYQCTLFAREFTPHILDIAKRQTHPVVVCVKSKHAVEAIHRAARHCGLRSDRLHANRPTAKQRRAHEAFHTGALDMLVVTPRALADWPLSCCHTALLAGAIDADAYQTAALSAPRHILILRTPSQYQAMRDLEATHSVRLLPVSLPRPALVAVAVNLSRSWRGVLRRHRVCSVRV